MAADQGSSAKAILYALLANFGIAITKTAAAAYTNSGSMLAEAIHSFADCANQLLLFLGLKQADKPATRTHPLGFGKVTYFWSFLVALLLFSAGGLFSIYEGWHKLTHPVPLNKVWVALVVLQLVVTVLVAALVGAVIMSFVAFRIASAFTSAILSARCGAFLSITGLNHSTILRPPPVILPFAVRVTMGPFFSHPRPTPLCTKMPWRSNENEMVSISPKDCFVDGLMLFTSFPS